MRLLREAHAEPALVLNERAVAARAWSPDPSDSPFEHIADPKFSGIRYVDWRVAVKDCHPANGGERASAPGKWIVNPLYVPRGSGGQYIRQFPSPQYQDEFKELTSLLPEEVSVGTGGDEMPFDLELARRRIILFVPEGY